MEEKGLKATIGGYIKVVRTSLLNSIGLKD